MDICVRSHHGNDGGSRGVQFMLGVATDDQSRLQESGELGLAWIGNWKLNVLA